jgi:hypothetical protein
MVVIGGYLNFCICDLDAEATIQKYVNIVDHGDAFRHVCKPTLEQWRKATGITIAQEKSFVKDKVFPLREERRAQSERQRLEEAAAKERERVEEEKKVTDALVKEVSPVENLHALCQTSQTQTHRVSAANILQRSIRCVFLPSTGTGHNSKFKEFLRVSKTPSTSVFKLRSDKSYTHADRHMIEDIVMRHKPKAIYLPNSVAWKAWQHVESDATHFGPEAGWQLKKFGDDATFAGADVFVGPAWSTSRDDQKPHWQNFGGRVAQQQQGRTEETRTSPTAIIMASRKRQTPDDSTSRRLRRRLGSPSPAPNAVVDEKDELAEYRQSFRELIGKDVSEFSPDQLKAYTEGWMATKDRLGI